jgi:hypothetical protein
MKDSSKEFIFRNGLRFEVTSDGLFYAPEEIAGAKKHPCPDCNFCQWCADSRCDACLQSCSRKRKKRIKRVQPG